MNLKDLSLAYLYTLKEQVELQMSLQNNLLISYQGFDYTPLIDFKNIIDIAQAIHEDNLYSTEMKINYVKYLQNSQGKFEEIEVNYILNNDNIKEVLENKKVLRKVSL